ncbi:MAG: bifunctional DNA-formamidopyrimidine glycosylase/DNA-(apurinic or apyrimidinic site) lyase [Candidatus Pacebacteria bacterium]|nr:bifunctional DNA-formamidopyrimidine glycosylase/DNA-(apurinic or apyrimidinic site) lyase [Candidatus Paceibacterota bacterium]MDR3583237.1 bifunctional DNA-formamidopyrimidine glycosylase/DNA-(apurinic or apyrimidinic site) lyase [Candidatus Paceibacterota bacterium]
MPELPEVQTIITDLNEKIKGDTVVSFWTDWGKTIKNKSAERFTKEIGGRKILGVRRIGKNIFLDLSGGKTLYIHLKMTGHLLVKSSKLKVKSDGKNYFDDKVNQYVHHIWKLKSGRTLEFSDLRKFGKIVLEDTDKINFLKEIKALGVDAMSEEFTFAKFHEILDRKKKSPVGLLLMDQNLIAGIGNIYRSEILFDAEILPTRRIETIDLLERKKLYASIGKILKKAIKYRGTSDSDYRDTSGAPGGYQKIARVYRRDKQVCQKCGTIIKREVLGQRSIFFCEKCQK